MQQGQDASTRGCSPEPVEGEWLEGNPRCQLSSGLGPSLLVAAVRGSAFVNRPSLLHSRMPERPSLRCLLVPWLTTCFPFPENRQKEQLSTKGRPFRGMSEEEVFTEVANLFRGQEDLLSEFGQFLPEATRSLVSTERPPQSGATLSARTPHLSAAFRPGQVYPLPRDAGFPLKPHPVQPPMGPECRLPALTDLEQRVLRVVWGAERLPMETCP